MRAGIWLRPWREGDIRRSVADVELARNILGEEPATDLTSGIKRLVEALG